MLLSSKKTAKQISAIVLAFTMAQPAVASEFCSLRNNLQRNSHEVGFFLSGKVLNVLRTNRPLEKNKNVTLAEAEKRVLKSIKNARPKVNTIEDTRLAKLITTASYTIGVDFQQFSGILNQESTFCQKRKNTSGSGASGCTQFTTIALRELKDQFGYKGTKNHTRSPKAEAILKELVAKYFAAQPLPERKKNFYDWLGSSTAQMQTALRGSGNFDIDILAGALLFKIQLALNGGSYYNALVDYNGDGRRVKSGKKTIPYKFKYASESQAFASTVSLDNTACLEAQMTTEEQLQSTCEIFKEDPMTCLSDPDLQPALADIEFT